jgi:HlyD family secretion protein
MDIELNNKKPTNYKKHILIVLVIVVIIFVAKYLFFLGQSDFSVDRESIVFAEVQKGKFIVLVRGSGVLVPDNIRWLSAGVEGKVERRIVKAGDVVKKGDLIVEIRNLELENRLAESKWELEAKIEEVNAGRIAYETSLISEENNVNDAKLNFEMSTTEFEARKKLVKSGAVSNLDFQRTKVEMEQAKQRWISSKKLLSKMHENIVAQTKLLQANLEQTRKMVERVERQVADLEIRASFDSIVLEMPLEIGERVGIGANVAKLAKQDSLIAELQIPEIQIREVSKGQKVLIDTRNSKFYGTVARVDPAIINGNVQVDVTFSEPLPADARPDLSVDGEIKVTEIEETLFVRRPLFSQSISTSKVYKIVEDQLAQRVDVKWGYGSVNQIEVREGLKNGDKIVVSDPSRYESYERFRIN